MLAMLEATTLLENKSDKMNYCLRPAISSSFLTSLFHFVGCTHYKLPLGVSTIVFERNFNNVPTIKSLLLRRSKRTNSKKVYPLYRELYKSTILLSL